MKKTTSLSQAILLLLFIPISFSALGGITNSHSEISGSTSSFPEFVYQSCSDNGDGTYSNPVIHADFPDPDVIRVGDIYYMVTTTMHMFPGATLLKSYDLVNWEYCNNPLDMIELNDGYNLLNGENHYSHGQWASAIRYHEGKFYILFNTLSEGGWLLTATDPEKMWDLRRLSRGYYDPGILFDDDKIYVVHGISELRVTEVDENFEPLGEDKLVVSRPNRGLEGTHFYKIGAYYYLYCTYGGWPASQTVFRSKHIYGPYEEKFLLDDDNIHQGALVQTQTGEWWTMLFYDKGPYGRLPNLQPVTWKDDWPVVGTNGKGVKTYKKPDVGKEYTRKVLPTNDNFRSYKLGMQWNWNHNPDYTKWSLVENPGYLRLKTTHVVSNFLEARNTLTQRIFGYHSNTKNSYGTICMDVSDMQDGDIAGLAVFQDPYAYIGIEKSGTKTYLVWFESKNLKKQMRALSFNNTIYLRAVANYGIGKAKFYYSTDNNTYTQFGDEFQMAYDLSIFVGNRFSIFNYATKQTGGYVDIDWFSTEEVFTEAMFYDDSFPEYPTKELTVDEIYVEQEEINLLIGTEQSLKLIARFKDGHTENITAKAEYSSDNSVVSVVNGQIIAQREGDSNITAVFEDLLGNVVQTTFTARVRYFHLVNGLFNPSIWTNGFLNEETGEIRTGIYGAGGWQYKAGIDISGFKYLVCDLQIPQNCGADLRLFDENSYWSNCAIYPFGNKERVVVNLHFMKKNESTDKCDPSHIYMICFWTHGGSSIYLKDIYLTNSDDLEKPSASVDEFFSEKEESPYVNVYTIMGIKIRSNVLRTESLKNLPGGIYIVGGKKIVVTNK